MLLIYELGVRPEYRRRRVGTALVEEAKRFCCQGGFMKMWVVSDASNAPAMRLYESTGGRRVAPDDVVFAYEFSPTAVKRRRTPPGSAAPR